MDPFRDYINDAVYYSKTNYYKLIFNTKKLFFAALQDDKINFSKEINKIWANVDHSYMKETLKELDMMVDKFNMDGHEILNANAKFETVYKLTELTRFNEVEKKYEDLINGLYNSAKKTINTGVDQQSYLTKLVERYNNVQAVVPYYNKDGSVRSYHNVADYNSMLYNTNLTRSAWNRTMYDSDLLGNDLMYLPAHPFACPLCIGSQGKVYSRSGKNSKYPPMQYAIDQGVGHPNCKHVWTIYWGTDQLQKDKFNSNEWDTKYQKQQKIQSLALERSKLKVDRDIYESIGNTKDYELVNKKISRLNKAIKELK